MPTPKRRLDPYGQPIPPLRDALAPEPEAREPESLSDTATNCEQRTLLLARMAVLIQEVCRRGWYGSVMVEVSVVDGTLKETMIERVRRHHS